MSFRRYVGKTVHVSAEGIGGEQVTYIARLFDYDDGGIWLHHSDDVHLPGDRTQQVEGLLFLPQARIINVFAFDGLDELLADEVNRQEQAGASRETATADSMRMRTAAEREVINSVGAVQPEELEGSESREGIL